MILNEEEFKEFIKPLQEINDCLYKAKVHWMDHSEDILNKALQDWYMTEEQENKYEILFSKIVLNIHKLIENIESTNNDITSLGDKLQLNK